MAQLLWGILCRRAITDQETNTVSYIDVVEAIGVPQLPLLLPPLVLGLAWRCQNLGEELQLRIRLTPPGEEEQDLFETNTFTFDRPHQRINLQFGVEIKHEGTMRLAVEQFVDNSWQLAYSLDVPISLREREEDEDEWDENEES